MADARILVECALAPLQGKRFQPTGFPDLGPAVYTLHDKTASVLVDSPQSVTNHLEAHCLTPDGRKFIDSLEGLSMVVAERDDEHGGVRYVTNSVQEGHRLASPYILGNKKKTVVGEEFDGLDKKGKPLADRKDYLKTIFKYDVNTLLHGAWFSRTGEGRIRIQRAVSAFIEADNAGAAEYGGVKRDHVTTSVTPAGKGTGDDDGESAGDASTGMGSIPYHRADYTAETITAYFNVDTAQIRAYNLGDHEQQLLETLALWKIRRFVESPFRPRTACDLRVNQDSIKVSPDLSSLPSTGELEDRLKDLVTKCRSSMGGDNGITTVKYTG